MSYRWKPSRAAKRAFADTMAGIDDFCTAHGIHQSRASDSYYFSLNGKEYRVSNHSVESSNNAAFRDGIQVRDLYHPEGRENGIVYIHAGKTRIVEIYNDLAAGYVLDGRGNRV